MTKFIGLYSSSDWAELFSLCANANDSGEIQRGSETWIYIHDWLCEYSRSHNFPPPEETETWSDTGYVIKEAVSFLEKFAENHHDDFENRKDVQDEQLRRNKKNGLYPNKQSHSN